MSNAARLDWDGLMWGTRRFLGLEDSDPVPLDELKEQAEANGYSQREVQQAIRATDRLENVGDMDAPAVVLAEGEESGPEDTQTEDVNPGGDASETTLRNGDNDENDSWEDARFDEPESNVWVAEMLEREQWMGHKPGDKQPFSPWADADAPVECKHHEEPTTCAECGHSARYKWGYEGNYTDHEEALEWVETDPRLAGLAFIQRDDDPLAFVDGDDVRCPETGELHPVFEAFLEHLGLTYADISVSGAGVHAVYLGSLPEGVKQAVWEIDDEPWGENDDLPAIEIYDGKHVCVATGEHVPGTPETAAEWDDDALKAVLEANGQMPTRVSADDYEEFDASDYEADATSSSETTGDVRDIYMALDRLDAQRVAERTIVDDWIDPSHAEYRAFVPTWAPAGYQGTANFVTSEAWKDSGTRGGKGGPACMAAIDAGLVTDRDCPERVNGETWWKAVDHLRGLGFEIPEYEQPDTTDEPTELDVTLDPEVAWRAVGDVTPEDVDEELPLDTTDDGTRWVTETGETVDVVRAAALADGLLADADGRLTDELFDAAYYRAKEIYGAPLPEYVTAETATDDWNYIQGALRQFTHRNLSEIQSDVTGIGGDEDERTVAELNPCWADSGSEKRIVALESGGFYCRKHERSLDPLRFVALETGTLGECDGELAGEEFKEAYHTAREEYGAPLPAWNVGNPDHFPVLPESEELLSEFVTDGDSLDAAREDVESLYRDLADDPGEATVLNALPALGKTTSVVKNAREHPALYVSPRKELQQEVADKADEYGVPWMQLPVFTEWRVTDESKMQALAIVREEGKDVLHDREALLERIEHPVFDPDEDDPTLLDDGLDRESSPVANGEYGDGWALVTQVAHELGHTPQEILTQGKALFGEEVPKPDDGDPYTLAWERATDPENPIDLLIGSRSHAFVAGARTYYSGSEDDVNRDPRAVAIDEFPGLDYATEYSERYLDHAGWLAQSLSVDVDDRKAMFDGDLWDDPWVRQWLRGNGDQTPQGADAVDALHAMQNAADVLGVVERLLTEERDTVAALGLVDALETAQDNHPEWTPERTQTAYEALDAGVKEAPTSEDDAGVLGELRDDVIPELATLAYELEQFEDGVTEAAVPAVVSGDLETMCSDAVDAFEKQGVGAVGLLDATVTALTGGEDGCRALALHASDGYAHPDAIYMLYGEIAEGDAVETVETDAFTFGEDGSTNVERSELEQATILVDRNQHGALVHKPPEFVAADGTENAVIGLDATGREELWSLALGRDVETVDIHDTAAERRAFLRDTMNVQVVQTSPHVQTYSGAAQSKNFDGDVALVEEVASEFSTGRLRQGKFTKATKPGVITTKKARREIEDRIEDTVETVDHYGNVTGSNALAKCNIGVVLGARHFGDRPVETWAALAGEETTRSGKGNDLDYGCETGNALLGHMRDDETMQAILRFGRDEDGAIVFAHTSALRDDVPVVGEGSVVKAHSRSAKAVARAARPQRGEFTVSDVVDDVECSRRTVRRVLSEFADLGYLEKNETKNGVANEFEVRDDPGPGHVDLPDVQPDDPDGSPIEEYYTWSVRVDTGSDGENARSRSPTATLPAPAAPEGDPPTGATQG